MTDREAILQRRRRFIALALAGGAAATAAGCDPCLSLRDAGADARLDAGTTGGPDACLSVDVGRYDAPADAAEPSDAPIDPDAGGPGPDAGSDAGNDPDLDAGKPLPCLSPPPGDPEP